MSEEGGRYEFSLFEGDPLNRVFAAMGIRSRGLLNLVARFGILFFVTALPTALFALWGGYGPGKPRAMNFFGDFAAWGQALIGYPLFVIGEFVIAGKTRSAANHFLHSGLVLDEDLPKIHALHEKVSHLRKKWTPDIICFVLGFLFAMFWLFEETHNTSDTWHAIGAPGVQSPTGAGYWVAFVGIPIFNYWWLRWIWKIDIWCWYLYKISRFRLRLIASHPDQTGGLGFLSEAQKSFAIIIFAFGIGIIAPLVGYKLQIEKAPLFSYGIFGPLAGFVLGAPAFFTIPLFMFTKQLARTKKRAVDAYQDRSTSAALYFERKWLNACPMNDEDCELLLGSYLQGMKNLNLGYEHIKHMRVVPFDLRSFTQMIGSTFGSLLPILGELVHVPDKWLKFFEMLKSLGGH